jgi:hypothetical protein
MIWIGIIGLILLAGCVLLLGCCAYNTNATCDFLKRQEHFLKEWRQDWLTGEHLRK